MIKTDRRILRSQALITDALLSLLMVKKFHEITIQEIADYANVGRATFYLHYHNKDECLLQLLTKGFDTLIAEINPDRENRSGDAVDSAEQIFQHAAQNRKLYLALLGEKQNAELFTQVQEYIAEKLKERILVPQEASPIIREAIAVFMAGALIHLLVWWLQEQPPLTSREVAELYVQLAQKKKAE